MKKFVKLKLFLNQPFKIINHGLTLANEEMYYKKNINSFNIEQLPTVDILELFPNFNEYLNNYSFLEGTSLVTDIMLLKSLARGFNNCECLEIGSWRGESISNICEVAKNCTSITLSKEEMKEMKLSDEFINIHGIFSKNIENLNTIYHNSHTFNFSSLNKKFDLIFIDGDHSYEGVLNDTKKTFNLRKDDNSVIVWHDYGFTTEKVRYSVLAAILGGVPENLHKNLYHVSNTLCAIYREQKF